MVVDAVIRLLPGAIDEASTAEESFAAGLLEYPQYTRPATFDGTSVPPCSSRATTSRCAGGGCAKSLRRTLERRPDLLDGRSLTKEEADLLAEIRAEQVDAEA